MKNARDVLRVGNNNITGSERFDKYESPANKQIRITSAVGKRTTSASRMRYATKGDHRSSSKQSASNDYEGETIKESA